LTFVWRAVVFMCHLILCKLCICMWHLKQLCCIAITFVYWCVCNQQTLFLQDTVYNPAIFCHTKVCFVFSLLCQCCPRFCHYWIVQCCCNYTWKKVCGVHLLAYILENLMWERWFFCHWCIISRVPTRYWKYWKSIGFWNQFSRPWKSIEFGQNVHKVLKKYGNSVVCLFKFCLLPLWQFCRSFFIVFHQ